jgi:hypothetical protein
VARGESSPGADVAGVSPRPVLQFSSAAPRCATLCMLRTAVRLRRRRCAAACGCATTACGIVMLPVCTLRGACCVMRRRIGVLHGTLQCCMAHCSVAWHIAMLHGTLQSAAELTVCAVEAALLHTPALSDPTAYRRLSAVCVHARARVRRFVRRCVSVCVCGWAGWLARVAEVRFGGDR